MVPAWMFQSGDEQGPLQSTPIVVNGVVYLSTNRVHVFAIDGATGRLIWQYIYEPSPGGRLSSNRGVAVAGGKVLVGTGDDFLIALDQTTGKEVWKVAVDDASVGGSISSAPLVVKDKVIVGDGGESPHRAYLTAFDIKTGRMLWRFYTVPGPGEKGHETWAGDSWKYGGAYPWMTGSYDPELNLVYWGTGNPDPIFYGGQRQGIDLYSCSIIALDADTGKLRWYYQEIPHDTWDYDSAWECVLLDRQVNGRTRKLLVHFGKAGYVWVLDRETGELLNVHPYSEVPANWVTGITDKGELVGRNDSPMEGEPRKLICPASSGPKDLEQTAYSPRTGLIYSPTKEYCAYFTQRPPVPGAANDHGGGTYVYTAPPGHDSAYSHIDALDPVTGKRQWTYPYKYNLLASMLATAGDLVLTGDSEGDFFALDAHTGKKLWSFQTGAGHRGSAVTYLAGGRQYIATPTGWGSVTASIMAGLWPEAVSWRTGSTLVVFALPEQPR